MAANKIAKLRRILLSMSCALLHNRLICDVGQHKEPPDLGIKAVELGRTDLR